MTTEIPAETPTAAAPFAEEPATVPGAGHTPTAVPAPQPLAAPGAAQVGVLGALLLIAAGIVGVRDAVVAAGWVGGKPWIPVAASAIGGLAPATWMAPVAVAVVVLGLALVVAAVLPRRRTTVALASASAVYLRRADVARIATAAARDVPGVLDARANASPRRVRVRCRITGDRDEGIDVAVAEAISGELESLQRPPRVVVRTRTEARS